MQKKIRAFQAVDARGMSILTILAQDEAEAVNRIKEELSKEGRRDFLKRWKEGGHRFYEVED